MSTASGDETNQSNVVVLLSNSKRSEMLELGQKLFNEDEFFQAHEAWEALWKIEKNRDKNFIQGLIQVAGHFVHLQKSNFSGAQSLGESALEKLTIPPSSNVYTILDIEPLTSALDYNLKLLSNGAQPSFDRFLVPKLFLKSL